MAITTSSPEKEVLVDPQAEKNAPGESGRNPAEMTTEMKKKKIKILVEVPASEVRHVMKYRTKPYKVDISDELITLYPEHRRYRPCVMKKHQGGTMKLN